MCPQLNWNTLKPRAVHQATLAEVKRLEPGAASTKRLQHWRGHQTPAPEINATKLRAVFYQRHHCATRHAADFIDPGIGKAEGQQEAPGDPRTRQESPGDAKRLLEALGSARRLPEAPGSPRTRQEAPGEPRRRLEAPGGTGRR